MSSLLFEEVRTAGEDAFFELFAAVRSEELSLDALPAALREQLLRTQFLAQLRGQRARFPGADEKLIVSEGRRVGWVITNRSPGELYGVDIALVREARGRGIGTRVIRALQDEAAEDNGTMRLSVLRSNAAAIALYERLGFRSHGGDDTHLFMRWSRRTGA